MATATVYAGNNFQSVANRINDITRVAGTNDENHLPVGWSNTTNSRWRAIVKFPNISASLPGGARIVKAEVWIKTTGSTYHVAKGSNARMKISRIIQSENPLFTGGSGEGFWSEASDVNPKGFELVSTGTITYAAEGFPGNGVVKKYDITDFVEFWLSSNYYKRDGSPCSGGVNNGIEIKSYDENSGTRTSEFWSTRGGYEPRLVVEYTTEDPPGNPTVTDPTAGDLLTAPTEATVEWASGTGDEGRLIIGTSEDGIDVYDSGWNAATPGATEVFDLSGVTWPVGQTLYVQARSRNDVGDVAVPAPVLIYILPVPTATLEWPGAGGRCHIWNLNALEVWTDGGAHAKPRVTVGYTHPTGVASQAIEVRIDGSTVHSFAVAIPSGGTKDLDINQALIRNTDFTIEVRAQGGGGQWSDWTSPVTARVNFGQALLSFSHASGASGFTSQHASLVGGSRAQVAYAYRAASEALWRATLNEVTPDTSMDVLVRLSTSDAAQVPSLASVGVQWSEDPPPVPDFWAATNAVIELDPAIRRFGVHSLKVVPAGAGWVTNSDLVVVSPNTEYTLSGYVNTLGATLPSALTLGYLDESGAGVTLTGDDASTNDSTGQGKENWQRLYATFVTGPDTTLVKPGLYHAGTGQFRMDSWQLESGGVASSWRPGTLGPAVILDVGGISIDGEAGGIFRARGSNGPVVTLGADGLELNGEPYITAADVPEPTPAAAPIRRVYTADATWTKPAGLHHIEVEVVGGGGGGGGCQTTGANEACAGTGGGGGGYARKVYGAAALPASCPVVVAGGGGGGGWNTDGGGGGASSFNTTLIGGGGAGGRYGPRGSGNSVQWGGAPGAGSGGDVNIDGQRGGNGHRMSFPGVSSAQGVLGLALGGGTVITPPSASASSANTSPADATEYGQGGAAGTVSQSQSSGITGAAGAGGVVIVTEFYE